MNTHTLPLVLSALVVGAGCNGAGSATGTVQLAAVAAPAESSADTPADPPDSLVHLDLAVSRIDVHVDATADTGSDDTAGDDSNGASEGTADDGGWITVTGATQLSLRPGENRIELGSAIVPVGQLTQIRLVLDGDAVLSNGLVSVELDCPSCSTSGLKLVVDGDVEIPEGGAVPLTLMFDLGATTLLGGGADKLGPVVHVQVATSG